MSLTKERAAIIHKFCSYVTKDISNLPERIVDGIRSHFGYNAIYGVREIDSGGNVIIHQMYGDNRYKRDHSLYREVLSKTDLFETSMARIFEESAARGKMVWTLQDLGYSYDEFFCSTYGKLAGKSGFGYKAIIVSSQPLGKYYHSLSIYKPKFQGDFTEDEMSFLETLAALFNAFFYAYLEDLRHQALKAVFNYKLTDRNSQLCIMDTHFDPLFKTNGFDKAIGKLFKKGSWTDFVLDVIGDMDEASSAVYCEDVIEDKNVKLRVCVYVPDTDISIFDTKLINVTIDRLPEAEKSEGASVTAVDYSCYGFTARELDVLNLLIRDESVDDIAEQLYMAKSTVRTHISHIYKKLGVRSRLEAVNKLRQ